MTHRSWPRAVIAGSAAATLLLSGCSVLQIRTAERESGPIRVGVEQQAGEDPTGEPTEPTVPEGMETKLLNLGAECPVDLSFALGPDWFEGSGSPAFVVFTRGSSLTDSDAIIVSCSEAFNESPQAVVDGKRQYTFSEQGSTVTAERTGNIGSGYYWTFQGVLGKTEIFAINQEPTVMYGARIGYQTNGRLVDIGIEMRALQSDEAAAEDFKKMLPTLQIDGESVPTPTFK